jgi:preprotein translocase subunit YajC
MRKKAWLFIIVLFLLMIAFVVYKDQHNESKRKQNWSLTKGTVVNITQDAMNGSRVVEITYKIQVDGKDITGVSKVKCGSWVMLPVNIKMDVVYEKDNPENCELLLSRSAYKTYNLQPPKEILSIIEILEASVEANRQL